MGLKGFIFEKVNEINKLAQPIQPNLGKNGQDWLCYLAGNFQMAFMIFFIFSGFFLNDFIKNPQTRSAPACLSLNISAIGSVQYFIQ